MTVFRLYECQTFIRIDCNLFELRRLTEWKVYDVSVEEREQTNSTKLRIHRKHNTK